MHRPWPNVDNKENLEQYLDKIIAFAKDFTILFPVHPRTKPVIEAIGKHYPNLQLVEPQPYLKFIYLLKNAEGSDYGFRRYYRRSYVSSVFRASRFGKIRERPETCTLGRNVLVGNNFGSWKKISVKFRRTSGKTFRSPSFGTVKQRERIVTILLDLKR